MDSENDFDLTPPNILEAAAETSSNLLPAISKDKYNFAYNSFLDWRKTEKSNSFSENVLLAYFASLSKKFKPSTLWTQYSMLKTTININNNVNIEHYAKLKTFLKRQSDGYRAKKSKVFTTEEINKFITEAPNAEFLLSKVVLIMGVMGACRRDEMYKMKMSDIQDFGSSVLIDVPNTKTKISRKFTITGQFYDLFKQYANLRPINVNEPHFFLNYQNGKCTVQRIGINKFGNMGKVIAQHLNLDHPELYTGHCFRRSSATILVDGGGDITSLKRHGGWKSTAVAEGYIDESLGNRYTVANKILSSIENAPSASTSKAPSASTSKAHLDTTTSTPKVIEKEYANSPKNVFNNCTFHITKM